MALYDIVFEGGGAKGIIFAGALQQFFQEKHEIRRVVGTSAGAITAALVAAGFSPEDMIVALSEKLADGKPRFSSFMDPPKEESFSQEDLGNSVLMQAFGKIDFSLIPNWIEAKIDQAIQNAFVQNEHYRQLFSLVEHGGLFLGTNFLAWIEEKLASKNVPLGATLRTFAQMAKHDLSVCVTDVTAREMLVLNARTAPDVPLAWAVRMSMSIPFVWQEVLWSEAWGPYTVGGKSTSKTGNTIVDGGVLSNFPIRLIASNDQSVKDVMGETDADGAGNLGLLIDESLDVAGAAAAQQEGGLLAKVGNVRTLKRVMNLFDTASTAQDNEQIRVHEQFICRCPANGYGTLEFDLAGSRLDAFLKAGQNAMASHLAKPQARGAGS